MHSQPGGQRKTVIVIPNAELMTKVATTGMHRLEAMRQEGVTEYTAKVREYTPQDAFYARIAASIGKPNELFRQRAERALREGFIRDLAVQLRGAALYQ
jgi:hypothetical protein